jgi:hypothetical protein
VGVKEVVGVKKRVGVKEVVGVKGRVGVLQAVNGLDEERLAPPHPSPLPVEGRGIRAARECAGSGCGVGCKARQGVRPARLRLV